MGEYKKVIIAPCPSRLLGARDKFDHQTYVTSFYKFGSHLEVSDG